MRNKKIVTCFIIINIIIIVIIYALINKKVNITKENKIIKEMNTSEYDSQITELNKSHEDYAMQVQANKKKLAQAISNEKVATSENATVDEMVTNIGRILQARTSDATATAEDIAKGKTAWVNGTEIIGTSTKYERQTSNYIPEGITEVKVMHVWYTSHYKNVLNISGEIIKSVSTDRLYQGGPGTFLIGLDEYIVETTGKTGSISIIPSNGEGTNYDYYYFYY